MSSCFSEMFMYLIAIDITSSAAESHDQFNQFYNQTHLTEVIANNPGFMRAHRYELLRQDPRGEFGPNYLTAYEIADERSAAAYADGSNVDSHGYTNSPPVWPELLDVKWRITYRKIAETASPKIDPELILLIGIDPPPDIDDDGIREFNDFYTNVHMPEVTINGGFRRATRYELHRGLKPPTLGCPRYLTVYEADSHATQGHVRSSKSNEPRPRAAGSDPANTESAGPEIWQRHTTPWRIWYRLIASERSVSNTDSTRTYCSPR